MLRRLHKDGFTLPTVMMVSMLMFGMLAIAMQIATVSASSLRDFHYMQIARAAVESGVAHASECLRLNGYIPTWTNAKPLQSNTDCSGNLQSNRSQYVTNAGGVRSSYSVALPISDGSSSQRVVATSTVELVRSGQTTVWKTYSQVGAASIGATTSFDTVTFGYSLSGAFFGIIDDMGKPMVAGYNGEGQLGDGTVINRAAPVRFQLPSGVTAQRMFTSFLSIGRYLFVTASDGNVYAAGRNVDGELGIGRTSAYEATPQKVVGIPAGVKIRSVAMTLGTTYFVGEDYRVYAAGACGDGRLGDGRSLTTCSGSSTPVRVSLPTPSSDALKPVLDSDWTQSTNIATDSQNVYVRTIGGRVYGWGVNRDGQLGRGYGNKTSAASPVRIGTFGDTVATRAKQIAFDGGTLYIVTEGGALHVVGRAENGQLLGAPTRLIYRSNANQCLTSYGLNNGLRLTNCSSSLSQLFTLQPDGRIADSNGVCIASLAATAGGSENRIMGANCTNNSNQLLWTLRADGRIRNNSTGTCLDMATATYSYTQGCFTTRPQYQEFDIDDATIVREVPLPAGTSAVRVTTDQRAALVLLNNGEVWGAGANDSGQLGIGSASAAVTKLTKMSLPSGRSAVDLYTTIAGTHTSANQYANTFVVLDNGRVVGAGSNHHNNLGRCALSASTYYTSPQYMDLPAGVSAKTVQSGLGTTIVLTESGQIYTVGNNQHGQLGDGTTVSRCAPGAHRYVNVLPPIIY